MGNTYVAKGMRETWNAEFSKPECEVCDKSDMIDYPNTKIGFTCCASNEKREKHLMGLFTRSDTTPAVSDPGGKMAFVHGISNTGLIFGVVVAAMVIAGLIVIWIAKCKKKKAAVRESRLKREKVSWLEELHDRERNLESGGVEPTRDNRSRGNSLGLKES